MNTEDKFVIECRYEIFGKNGKEFIPWFIYDSNPFTKDEANIIIKNIKTNFKYIDTKTKLKHEYQLKSFIDYENEKKQLIKENKELEKKQKEYFKSAEYKELQRKKRIANKELKEKQKKYIEEHKKLDK